MVGHAQGSLSVMLSLPQDLTVRFRVVISGSSMTGFGRSETVTRRLAANAYSRPLSAGRDRLLSGRPI
jgi:hypothetical protein